MWWNGVTFPAQKKNPRNLSVQVCTAESVKAALAKNNLVAMEEVTDMKVGRPESILVTALGGHKLQGANLQNIQITCDNGGKVVLGLEGLNFVRSASI